MNERSRTIARNRPGLQPARLRRLLPLSVALSSAFPDAAARSSPGAPDVLARKQTSYQRTIKCPSTVWLSLESGKTCSPCQLLRIILPFYRHAENGEERPGGSARRYRFASCVSYLLSVSAAVFSMTDIAAVALRQHVLRNCFTVERHIIKYHRRLNRDVKLLTWDQIFHLPGHQRRDHAASYRR